jgi:hypothetical protein
VGNNDFLAGPDSYQGLRDFFDKPGRAKVKDLPRDPITHAHAMEVTPEGGEPFRVTERTAKRAGEVGRGGELPAEGETAAKPEARNARTRDLAKLRQRLGVANSVQRVIDPILSRKFDAKIQLDEDAYYREKEDRTWCRFSATECDVVLPEINPQVDQALARTPPVEPVLADPAASLPDRVAFLEQHRASLGPVQEGRLNALRDRMKAGDVTDADIERAKLGAMEARVDKALRESYTAELGFAGGRPSAAPGAHGKAAGTPEFTSVQQARHDRIADYLQDRGLDWGDLFRSRQDVLDFFAAHRNLDEALTALEGRARQTADLRVGIIGKARLQGIGESASSGLNPFDTPLTGEQIRQTVPGVATGGRDLPAYSGRIFDPTRGPVARIPGQIAARLRFMEFRNWRQFRETFWTMMSEDAGINNLFSPSNQQRMANGLAPVVEGAQRTGAGWPNITLNLDHAVTLEEGGGLYDLDNIQIVTPAAHQTIGTF